MIKLLHASVLQASLNRQLAATYIFRSPSLSSNDDSRGTQHTIPGNKCSSTINQGNSQRQKGVLWNATTHQGRCLDQAEL